LWQAADSAAAAARISIFLIRVKCSCHGSKDKAAPDRNGPGPPHDSWNYWLLVLSDGVALVLSEGVEVVLLSLAPADVVSVVGAAMDVSALIPASLGCAAVVSVVGAGVCPIVLSVGAAWVVSAATAVVSPRSGAAPTSSSDRLWHAANEAAAASIRRYLMNCSSSEGTLPA
jgi:hypothetical protein